MSGTPNEILATIWRSMTILTGTIYIIVLWHITTNKTGQDINTKTKINMNLTAIIPDLIKHFGQNFRPTKFLSIIKCKR